MNIVSILITLAGIIAILALYVISKLSQQKQPKDKVIIIPKIHDDEGHLMSSVLGDFSAADGSTPPPIAKPKEKKLVKKPVEERQIVLFIATLSDTGLDGNKIPSVLEKHNLQFGDMDIYHYLMNTEQEKDASIFRIANGVKPWTLIPNELANRTTPGLSIIMQLPSPTNDYAAMELFISHAEGIAIDLDAQLKNAKQENFSDVDKEELLASVS
ncbi:MAG: cell division protein ZipA C-terminal FtsZ-binding domain-containing protein [Cocleimonas sp.]|nr:cell division protein ZipA C-terminal FtsZ-binding domain-containing protein [Cocleimonas sp.]